MPHMTRTSVWFIINIIIIIIIILFKKNQKNSNTRTVSKRRQGSPRQHLHLFVGHVPDHITDLLTHAAIDLLRSSSWSSSNSHLIIRQLRQARRKIGHRAFSVAAPREWNRLPRAEDHVIDYTGWPQKSKPLPNQKLVLNRINACEWDKIYSSN